MTLKDLEEVLKAAQAAAVSWETHEIYAGLATGIRTVLRTRELAQQPPASPPHASTVERCRCINTCLNTAEPGSYFCARCRLQCNN